MRRCFKFEVQECQNVSLETWIKVAKFSKTIRIRSEDKDKMYTENFYEVENFHKM